MLPWEVLHSMETLVGMSEMNFYSERKRTRKPTMNALVIVEEKPHSDTTKPF
jgi:hypothetical protein